MGGSPGSGGIGIGTVISIIGAIISATGAIIAYRNARASNYPPLDVSLLGIKSHQNTPRGVAAHYYSPFSSISYRVKNLHDTIGAYDVGVSITIQEPHSFARLELFRSSSPRGALEIEPSKCMGGTTRSLDSNDESCSIEECLVRNSALFLAQHESTSHNPYGVIFSYRVAHIQPLRATIAVHFRPTRAATFRQTVRTVYSLIPLTDGKHQLAGWKLVPAPTLRDKPLVFALRYLPRRLVHLAHTLTVALAGRPTPDPGSTILRQGDALLAQDKYQEAIAAYKTLTEDRPSRAEAWRRLGHAYASLCASFAPDDPGNEEHRKQAYGRGDHAYKRATALDPLYGPGWVERVDFQRRAGAVYQALVICEEGLKYTNDAHLAVRHVVLHIAAGDDPSTESTDTDHASQRLLDVTNGLDLAENKAVYRELFELSSELGSRLADSGDWKRAWWAYTDAAWGAQIAQVPRQQYLDVSLQKAGADYHHAHYLEAMHGCDKVLDELPQSDQGDQLFVDIKARATKLRAKASRAIAHQKSTLDDP